MNFFKKNRQSLQRALYDSKFLEQLKQETHLVVEKNNEEKKEPLKTILIKDIPLPAWRVDLEMKAKTGIFSLASGKPEQAVFFYTQTSLVVLLIEMKSTIRHKMLADVERKFGYGIEKLLSFLPAYTHGKEYDTYNVVFIGLLAYRKGGEDMSRLIKESSKQGSIYQTAVTLIDHPERVVSDENMIEANYLGKHKIYYAFHQENSENTQYSLQPLLQALNINTDAMHTCPSQQENE